MRALWPPEAGKGLDKHPTIFPLLTMQPSKPFSFKSLGVTSA